LAQQLRIFFCQGKAALCQRAMPANIKVGTAFESKWEEQQESGFSATPAQPKKP